MTLLEQLQQRLANIKPAQAPQAQQQQLTAQLQAGTGKAGTGTTAKQSSLGEQAALAQGQQQLQQQQQQGIVAAQQIGQQAQEIQAKEQLQTEQLAAQKRQEQADLASKSKITMSELATQEELQAAKRDAESYMRLNEMTQKYEQFLKQKATERSITEDKLFANYTREQAKLEFDKAGSELNQELFALTMANKKYINTIQEIGARKQLQNAANFQQEMQNLTWGKEYARALQEYEFMRSVDISEREYKKQLAQIDADSMMTLFKTMADANRDATYIAGVGTAATTYAAAQDRADRRAATSTAGKPVQNGTTTT